MSNNESFSILLTWEVENMAALDRGKLVVLFIFGISIVAGALACWHLYEKGDQAKDFWSTESANLIYHAPQVELLKLHVGDDLPTDRIEEIDIEGKTRAVIDRIDVYRGSLVLVTHARNEPSATSFFEREHYAMDVYDAEGVKILEELAVPGTVVGAGQYVYVVVSAPPVWTNYR